MASQTILNIVKSVAQRVGLPVPTTVVSTDRQVQQLVALANEEGEELADRYNWTALQKEATWVTIAAEDQGVLNGTILAASAGFKYVINDTIWNRTTQFKPGGPISPKGWQGLKATPLSGFWSQYRIRGGHLLFLPAASAGQTVAFEYVTENWAVDTLGTTGKSEFTADDDYPLLDSKIIRSGLVWRWKAAKGLSYQEDFQKYENLVADAMARDGTKGRVSLNGNNPEEVRPFILVPAGNWGVP
jgi:hypothetical protein